MEKKLNGINTEEKTTDSRTKKGNCEKNEKSTDKDADVVDDEINNDFKLLDDIQVKFENNSDEAWDHFEKYCKTLNLWCARKMYLYGPKTIAHEDNLSSVDTSEAKSTGIDADLVDDECEMARRERHLRYMNYKGEIPENWKEEFLKKVFKIPEKREANSQMQGPRIKDAVLELQSISESLKRKSLEEKFRKEIPEKREANSQMQGPRIKDAVLELQSIDKSLKRKSLEEKFRKEIPEKREANSQMQGPRSKDAVLELQSIDKSLKRKLGRRSDISSDEMDPDRLLRSPLFRGESFSPFKNDNKNVKKTSPKKKKKTVIDITKIDPDRLFRSPLFRGESFSSSENDETSSDEEQPESVVRCKRHSLYMKCKREIPEKREAKDQKVKM